MKHIVLIGFMGAGKTSVGQQLAAKAQIPFVDMDDEIVKKMGMPITEIFQAHGELYFRQLETQILKELLSLETCHVISAGGGVPVQEANPPLLGRFGLVVYLKTGMQTLLTRLQGDTARPILQGGNLKDKITLLQAQRAPIYEKVSDIQVLTDDKTPSAIAGEIMEVIKI